MTIRDEQYAKGVNLGREAAEALAARGVEPTHRLALRGYASAVQLGYREGFNAVVRERKTNATTR